LNKLVELYAAYREVASFKAFDVTFVSYDWAKDTQPNGSGGLAYGLMLQEFSQEIGNSINELVGNVCRLSCWQEVISGLEQADKVDVLHEFVNSIAVVSLNLPHVIRSRFVFASLHLCHQANQYPDGESWKDELPLDSDIYFGQADAYCGKWKRYKKLKVVLEKIANKKYQTDTRDFRNKYNHRFSPLIEFGLGGFVSRNVNDKTGIVSYSFGYQSPLPLSKVVHILKGQVDVCRSAHSAFQLLIKEHRATFQTADLDSAPKPAL